MRYRIRNVLNNNVIMVEGFMGKECVLIGNGIGFARKSGDFFADMDKVQKKYALVEKGNQQKFSELLSLAEPELVAVVEEEICYIESHTEYVLNENIHITLLDHIVFAINRSRRGVDFHYSLSSDIAVCYPEEYGLARHIVRAVNERLDGKLVDDEIGIVALHIHAAITNEHVSESRKRMQLCRETVKQIYQEFALRVGEDSLAHQRLLLHVRYAYERIFRGASIDNALLEEIRQRYPREFEVLKRILLMVGQDYELTVPDAEVGYLVMHLLRIQSDMEQIRK